MRLPVLTGIRSVTTAVDFVAQYFLVQRAACALVLKVVPTFASPCPSTSRHRKNSIGRGSSQDHANEAERCWLQGVALEFFSGGWQHVDGVPVHHLTIVDAHVSRGQRQRSAEEDDNENHARNRSFFDSLRRLRNRLTRRVCWGFGELVRGKG